MTQKHCACNICSRFTFVDTNGAIQKGQLVDFYTFRRHAARARREGSDLDDGVDDQSQSIVECTIVSRTLDRGRDGDGDGIPARQRDTQDPVHFTGYIPQRKQTPPVAQGTSNDGPDDFHTAKGDLLREITRLNLEVDRRCQKFMPGVCPILTFPQVPSSYDSADDLQLEPMSTINEQFISHVGWLAEISRTVHAMDDTVDPDLSVKRKHLITRIDLEVEGLRREKQRQWKIHRLLSTTRTHPQGQGSFNVADSFDQAVDIDNFLKPSKLQDPICMITTFLVIALHVLAGLSRLQCRFVLIALRATVFAAFRLCGPSITSSQQTVLDQIPKDIRTAVKYFNLKPEIVRYACCSNCFALYAPDPTSHVPYPAHCTFQETSDRPSCGAELLRPDNTGSNASQPVRVFGYQPVSSWLARLLSRPGLISLVENAWNTTSSDGIHRDIWDASGLRELKGPDGKPFLFQPAGSTHLVFSLFVDWFNPYSNKQAGKSHSTGVIYMVCLNLPRHLRYKLENVYLVGVIPGPREPSLSQINHLLRPLVNDLLHLWTTGLRLRSTRQHRDQCLVRCALVPLVCDIPALRKTAGFAGHGSNFFCSFCSLPLKHILDLDKESWPRRSWAEHIALAECWRNAATFDERQEIFKLTGLRWSELLRLPYWNPTRFALLDAMHNLFLGELQHHCRNVWGISIKTPNATSKVQPHTPERQALELETAAKAIRNGSVTKLKAIRKGYISAIARFNGVVPTTSMAKRDYIETLVEWFRQNPQVSVKLPPILDRPISDFVLVDDDISDLSTFTVLSADLLQTVRDDICRTTLPSWVSRPPRNFGSPTHGKLTADQWRSVCTINLVITLIREWSLSSALPRDRHLLTNFVDLIIAVDIATRRSTSQDRIASYNFHMMRYLQSLGTLFEKHSLVSNHHLSLHLDECLALFGPVHAWWSFPFERYNGVMQKLNTNYKPGDIEITFLETFSVGSNLRAAASELDWPPLKEYKEMLEEFHQTFSTSANGSLLDNIIPRRDVPPTNMGASNMILEEWDYQQLLDRLNRDIPDPMARYIHWVAYDSPLLPLSRNVHSLRSLKVAEAEYAPPGKNKGNSFVLVNADPGSDKRVLVPAQIQMVFLHSRRLRDGTDVVEPFFVVRDYLSLSDEDQTKDPYLAFPLLETRLYYNSLNPHSRILKQADIVCHFASYIYEPENMVGKNGAKISCIVGQNWMSHCSHFLPFFHPMMVPKRPPPLQFNKDSRLSSSHFSADQHHEQQPDRGLRQLRSLASYTLDSPMQPRFYRLSQGGYRRPSSSVDLSDGIPSPLSPEPLEGMRPSSRSGGHPPRRFARIWLRSILVTLLIFGSLGYRYTPTMTLTMARSSFSGIVRQSYQNAMATLTSVQRLQEVVEDIFPRLNFLEIIAQSLAQQSRIRDIEYMVEELFTRVESMETTQSLAATCLDRQDVQHAYLRLLKELAVAQDFALAAAGAKVVSLLTTHGPQRHGWLRSQSSLLHPPDVVLDGSLYAGSCWDMSGPDGQLGISLARPVVVTHVTVDHNPQDPVFDAPRHAVLWGVIDGKVNRNKASGIQDLRPIEFDHLLSSRQGPPDGGGLIYVLLAYISFDISGGEWVQRFPVVPEILRAKIDFGVVVFEVLDNWGGNSTCLYRVRIHGE